MEKFISELLDKMNEGITILDDNYKIVYWNNYLEEISQIQRMDVIGKDIYQAIPSLNKNYYINTLEDVLKKGTVMFFSAAMHKDLLNTDEKLNLKISRLDNKSSKLILLEFINVSNKIAQVNQLKEYVCKLYAVNKELLDKEKIIKKLAYFDNLTGVANRTLFYKVANRYLKEARESQTKIAVMFIDIDEFKFVNDNYGHMIGDKMLVKVASILQNAVSSEDLVARYGGDEFLILVKHHNIEEYCNKIIDEIKHTKDRILTFNNINQEISLSIGVSFYPRDGETIDQIMVKADQAMYLTKKYEESDI